MAVLVHPGGLIAFDTPTPPQLLHNPGEFVRFTWRYQCCYRMPYYLFRFVAVYLFSALVPTDDGAIQSFPNDGIVRSLDDGGQVQLSARLRSMSRMAVKTSVSAPPSTKLRLIIAGNDVPSLRRANTSRS